MGRDPVDDQMQRFLDHLAVERGLSTNTVEAYRRDLRRYRGWLRTQGVRDATEVDEAPAAGFVGAVSSLRREDGTPYAASTAARALSSVRGFHRFLTREEHAGEDPTSGVVRPRVPRGLPHPLSLEEAERLLSSVDGAVFDIGSATYSMTRILTGQLDAYIDVGPRMIEVAPWVAVVLDRPDPWMTFTSLPSW